MAWSEYFVRTGDKERGERCLLELLENYAYSGRPETYLKLWKIY
jgi:hypothetical protein